VSNPPLVVLGLQYAHNRIGEADTARVDAVAAVAASTCDMLETSMVCVKTVPRPFSSPAVRVVSASSRSHNATLAPDASNRSLIARPNPCAAPVTTARRPFRSNWFKVNLVDVSLTVSSFQFPVSQSVGVLPAASV